MFCGTKWHLSSSTRSSSFLRGTGTLSAETKTPGERPAASLPATFGSHPLKNRYRSVDGSCSQGFSPCSCCRPLPGRVEAAAEAGRNNLLFIQYISCWVILFGRRDPGFFSALTARGQRPAALVEGPSSLRLLHKAKEKLRSFLSQLLHEARGDGPARSHVAVDKDLLAMSVGEGVRDRCSSR